MTITFCRSWLFYSCWYSVRPSDLSLDCCPHPSVQQSPESAARDTLSMIHPLWVIRILIRFLHTQLLPYFPLQPGVNIVPSRVIGFYHQSGFLCSVIEFFSLSQTNSPTSHWMLKYISMTRVWLDSLISTSSRTEKTKWRFVIWSSLTKNQCELWSEITEYYINMEAQRLNNLGADTTGGYHSQFSKKKKCSVKISPINVTSSIQNKLWP